jgi:hypothetical protein
MSYEKVRSIKIDTKENKVFITSACNNLIPLYYERWNCEQISNVLIEKGRLDAEAHILKAFEEGSFQGTHKKYSTALKVLKYELAEEYSKYDWVNNPTSYGTPEYDARRESRNSEEFYDLLKKALSIKAKSKFVICKVFQGEKIFAVKKPNKIYWVGSRWDATAFDYEQEARDLLKWYNGSDGWVIEKRTK